MLDTMQVIFWSITYVLVIVAGFMSRESKKVSMPYLACIQNFSWEICALLKSHGFWAHIIWLALDVFIVCIGFYSLNNIKQRIGFATAIILYTSLFFICFTIPEGMLVSSFIIDLIMAICFLVSRKRLSPKLKISIATTKLLGDTFAGLYYAPMSNIVAVIAIAAFVCNISYLILCIKDRYRG